MENTVRLRDVETADLEAFLAYEHDPEAVRRSRFPPREREAFMAHWTSKVLGDPANLVQTVVVDGGTAGNIVAWWEGERRYIGYWLGRPYWGRGIGTRALTAFLELETARPLYADPVAGNTGSVRLLEKCGFVATGTERHGENEHVVLVLGGGA
ncbi:GNAT family N-acetyltransferase [Streptomyces anulatus]|uniref:GNAT family N-acetyltransferase n=1 Tax=Streptomyces TaxID=1883 RepID=UPI001B3702B6|nr:MULTISPECIES: GNAT family N-acetyltransferase [Streptomyces]MBQ1108681.1 GNAT family N-acetyltransferase [Streptomyces sp. 404i]MBQ1113882.1 GNAT family N-acetyltransferase [Streptomyces sp. C3-3]WIY76740.1 GNAT family N-acetyltransferase [Streptomyces anulatus]